VPALQDPRGKLQAFLPTDKGINPTPEEPPQEIKISVHIVARQEKKHAWGPKPRKGQPDKRVTVTMPTVVKYRFGDRETNSLKAVAKWIKDAKAAQTGDVKVIGEIKAAHKVPHKFVVAVLNKFAAAGMEKVDFYGTAIPGAKLRRMEILPYPSSNYVGVSSD